MTMDEYTAEREIKKAMNLNENFSEDILTILRYESDSIIKSKRHIKEGAAIEEAKDRIINWFQNAKEHEDMINKYPMSKLLLRYRIACLWAILIGLDK